MADKNEKTVVGSGFRGRVGRLFLLWKRKLILIILVIVLITGGVLIVKHQKREVKPGDISNAQNSGKYKEAENYLKKSIGQTSSNQQKAALYTQLGNTYIDANEP